MEHDDQKCKKCPKRDTCPYIQESIALDEETDQNNICQSVIVKKPKQLENVDSKRRRMEEFQDAQWDY